MSVERRPIRSQCSADRVDPVASLRWRVLRRAALAVGLASFAVALQAAPIGAQEADLPAQESPSAEAGAVSGIDAFASRLGGWSPQFEFGFGVLTQSHDGQTTVPTTSGSRVLRDSGDSIISGFSSFGLGVLSPVIVESDWKPRVVVRSSIQIPISDGLISDRADLNFEPDSADFEENCPDPVPGSNVETSTCSIEVRDRTTVNMLWTAGLGLDFLLPTEERIFHVQPAIEYIGMMAQPEGTYKRQTTGRSPDPPPLGSRAQSTEFIKQTGASEIFHGVATALTASTDAYRDGPWVWSLFLNGRAAWFLTDRKIQTRRTNDAGDFIFVTEPAVNDAKEVQWQAMVGFTVRFDPLSE